MTMIQSAEELKEVQGINTGGVRNEIDSPNLLSASSISPLNDLVGEKEEESEEKEEAEASVKSEEKKEEKEKEKEKVKSQEEEKAKASLTAEEQSKDWVQKRIDTITRKRREAENQLEFERKKRLEVEEELRKLKNKIPAVDKPIRGDFDNEDEYIEALIDWKAEQKFRGIKETESKAQEEQVEKEAIKEADDDLYSMVERGRETFKDFNEVVMNKDLKLSKELIEAALTVDEPEKLLYYLGKNPDEAAVISGLDHLQILYELGKISAGMSAKVEGKKDEENSSPRKKITKAPEPIASVRASAAVEKDPSEMSPREYRAWRERNK